MKIMFQPFRPVINKEPAIPLTSFGLPGAANIPPLALESQIEVLKNYTIDLRGLDCGITSIMSEFYVVFQ
jgi:hypothetical protein